MSADTKASGTLASRYARALLDLAAEQGALAAVEADMAALGAMLEVCADLRALVRGKALARASLGSAMQALGRKAGFHALSVNFLGVLAANGRLSSLDAVLEAFRHESAARRGVVDAKIETAFPLSTGQTRTLKEAIGKRLGASEVALDVSVNRALIGADPSWRVRLVATDIDTKMLARTKEGIYNQFEVNRGLPARLLVRYFARHGMNYQIDGRLRAMVETKFLNLAESFPPMPACDVVFLRNVLIYFDVDTKRAILGQVKKVIKPDGYLFLGGAETTMNVDDAWERQTVGRATVYRPR